MTKITFITDYVCPFCIVAKKALELALTDLDFDAEIHYIPFELTREPSPQVDTYHDERRRANYKVLEAPAKAMGMDLYFPPAVIPRPYSRLAFEGLLYAKSKGKGERYNDRLYFSYFQDQEDIGDIQTLVKIAESLGLDGVEFRTALEEGWFRKEEEGLQEMVRKDYSFRGIPAIYVDGRKIELQEYTPEEMKSLLLATRFQEGGMYCGEDGCHSV